MQEQAEILYADICKVLAHPARIRILELLRGGERCVCVMAKEVGISESNLSQHLAILRKGGLVETRREGHSIYYRIRDRRILGVLEGLGAILAEQAADRQAVLGNSRN